MASEGSLLGGAGSPQQLPQDSTGGLVAFAGSWHETKLRQDNGRACRAPSNGITLTAVTRGSRSARPSGLVRSPPMYGGARALWTVLHNRKRKELCGHNTAPRCAHKSADRVLSC